MYSGITGSLCSIEIALYRLLARGMELPEETFVNCHGFSSVGETYGESILSLLLLPILIVMAFVT
jgi:hypothetical protein